MATDIDQILKCGGILVSGSAYASFDINAVEFFYTSSYNPLIPEPNFEENPISPTTYLLIVPFWSYTGNGNVSLSSQYELETEHWDYIGGVYPDVLQDIPLQYSQYFDVISESTWLDPDKVIAGDNAYTYSDVSFLKTSRSLKVSQFDPIDDIPPNVNFVGIEVEIKKYSIGQVKDLEVYVYDGDTQVSNNLANISSFWSPTPEILLYGNPYESFAISDLNDLILSEDLNVRIKVKGQQNIAGIIAFVDYIRLNFYFEFDNLSQKVRVEGDANVQAQPRRYRGSGNINVEGNATYLPTLSFKMGKGSIFPNYSAITITGHPEIGLTYTAIPGAIVLGGVALVVCTAWNYTSIPGIEPTVSGDAIWISTAYQHIMTGGIVIGAKTKIGRRYLVYPGITPVLSGSSYVNNILVFTSSSPIIISGESLTESTNYHYFVDLDTGFPLIDETSGALYDTSALTLPEEMIGMFDEIDSIDLIFGIAEAEPLVEDLSTFVKCGCTLPLKMQCSQNLGTNNKLTQFLRRNLLTMPTNIVLNYNIISDIWQSNFHFKGTSTSSNFAETWDVVFKLQCTNMVGGYENTEIFWVFSIFVIQKTDTLTPPKNDFETRFLVSFTKDLFCVNDRDFETQISMNTKTRNATVSSAEVVNLVLYDNIGLFKNQFWFKNPNLLINLSEVEPETLEQTVDLTDAVFV